MSTQRYIKWKLLALETSLGWTSDIYHNSSRPSLALWKNSSNIFELTTPNHPVTEIMTNVKNCQKNFVEIDCGFTLLVTLKIGQDCLHCNAPTRKSHQCLNGKLKATSNRQNSITELNTKRLYQNKFTLVF